jgi:hypothetical protein
MERYEEMTHHSRVCPRCFREDVDIHLKSTCDVNLLSKLSIIFKEWRVIAI